MERILTNLLKRGELSSVVA